MTMESMTGWTIGDILGGGGFGDVRLFVNKKTNDKIAMKCIQVTHPQDTEHYSQNEIDIHRNLIHENIVRFLCCRQEGESIYLFMEFAAGGDLCDRIKPGVGVEIEEARIYFRQILAGIEYLHDHGIAHRDVKIENILLDGKNTVKLTDFGLSTCFRKDGTEKMLHTNCGTENYVAPELLIIPCSYRGPPVDLWSCGIVLVTLLTGELPWKNANIKDDRFKRWYQGKTDGEPWKRIEVEAIKLLKGILKHNPEKRFNISQIQNHSWTKDKVPPPPTFSEWGKLENMPSSNPAAFEQNSLGSFGFLPNSASSSTLMSMSPSSQHHLIQRSTRLCVKTSKKETLTQLGPLLTNLSYNFIVDDSEDIPTIKVTTVDKRNVKLVFIATVYELQNDTRTLIDFRRSDGDGLEFKKQFTLIKTALEEIGLLVP